MGSITNRLRALEERGREQATDEVRRAWMRLSDEEMVLILAPSHAGRPPKPEELAPRAWFRESVPESLIARAIAFSGEMSDAEIGRRLRELLEPVLDRRRRTVTRKLQEAG